MSFFTESPRVCQARQEVNMHVQKALNEVENNGTLIKIACIAGGVLSGILVAKDYPLGYLGTGASVLFYIISDSFMNIAYDQIRMVARLGHAKINAFESRRF